MKTFTTKITKVHEEKRKAGRLGERVRESRRNVRGI
jgi:hypothetical protein